MHSSTTGNQKVMKLESLEVSKVCDYAKESDHLAHITKVILHLLKYMEDNPVRYPQAIMVYTTLRFGLIPVIKVNCPHDEDCSVNGGSPCGGLDDTLAALEEAYECLDLEMDWEVPPYQYPADYQI